MLRGTHVICLGLAQLVLWGTGYYSIGVFGPAFETKLGLEKELVYGGLSAALFTMGLISPAAGKLVQGLGGFRVMAAGALIAAVSNTALSFAGNVWAYYGAWIVHGIALRLTLYDAAFAMLAQVGGAKAGRAISQVTLLGGLASSVFWPVGHALEVAFGIETALRCYGALALAAILLLLPFRALGPVADTPHTENESALGAPGDHYLLSVVCYLLIATTAVFLLAGISSQLIPILAGLGLAPATAVFAAAWFGVGQVTARVIQVVFGRNVGPLRLNVIAAAIMVLGFSLGLLGDGLVLLAFAFAALYGAGHGLLTIVRGTLPLVLFDQRTYAARVGKLIVPGFFFAAAAPTIYAYLMQEIGERGTVAVSWGLASMVLGAAVILKRRLGR